MSTKRAVTDGNDERFPMVLVGQEDLVWDAKLGYHRCPLGLIQTPREILACRERDRHGGLKLYLRQLERESLCDVVVVYADEHEVCVRAVTCARGRVRAKHPRIVSKAQKWHGLPPLNGRALIDAETNEEVWVHRIEDPPHADLPRSSLRPDTAPDPDLDIPF